MHRGVLIRLAPRFFAGNNNRSPHVSNNAKKSGPFDVKTVEALVALMADNDMSEIYLKDGNQHLRLRRGGAVAAPFVIPATTPVAHAHTAAPTAGPAPTVTPAAPAKSNLIEI